jgi:S1-C subfamily serine protease
MTLISRILMLLMMVSTLSAQRPSDLGRLGGGASNPFGSSGAGSSRSSNPFGTNNDSSVKNRSVLFDVTKVGLLGRMETREKFDYIWSEFRRTHAIDVRGCFSPQDDAATQDDSFTQNAFQQYVRLHSPTMVMLETEKCVRCGPDGTIPRAVGLEVIYVSCPVCAGAKTQKFLTEYRLIWPGKIEPKAPLPVEMRAAIGFKGSLPHSSSSTLRLLEDVRYVAKPSNAFGVADISTSIYKGRLDFVFTFAGKPDLATRKVGYVVNFYSEAEGRGQVLAMASGEASAEGSTRMTFAQFEYPGVVAESFRLTSEYYAEALGRLAAARSVVVSLSDIPSTLGKLSSVEKEPKIFALKVPAVSAPPVASDSPKTKRTFYGSGMVFTTEGHVFTNQHVIDEGTEISIVVFANGQLIKRYPATVVSKDAKMDLAILRVEGWTPPEGSQPTPPRLTSSVKCKSGDPVFVWGFPLPSTLSSNVKYTRGDISDTSGIGDDSTKIQHTANIQPGNSGGPMALLDGRVVGVVVSSLSAAYMMKKTGSIPQGVNFSIKTDYLLTMAKVAGVDLPEYPASLSPVDHVKNYTVQIMCE